MESFGSRGGGDTRASRSRCVARAVPSVLPRARASSRANYRRGLFPALPAACGCREPSCVSRGGQTLKDVLQTLVILSLPFASTLPQVGGSECAPACSGLPMEDRTRCGRCLSTSSEMSSPRAVASPRLPGKPRGRDVMMGPLMCCFFGVRLPRLPLPRASSCIGSHRLSSRRRRSCSCGIRPSDACWGFNRYRSPVPLRTEASGTGKPHATRGHTTRTASNPSDARSDDRPRVGGGGELVEPLGPSVLAAVRACHRVLAGLDRMEGVQTCTGGCRPTIDWRR